MTVAIPSELSAILVAHFRTFCKDGVALPSDKRSVRGIHSLLAQLASGVDRISSLERVTLIRLIERLEEIQTKVQGMISSPHLVTTLLYNMSQRWTQNLNRCVTASDSEVV